MAADEVWVLSQFLLVLKAADAAGARRSLNFQSGDAILGFGCFLLPLPSNKTEMPF